MTNRYFFDIPVYRLSREDYYTARDAHIEKMIYQPGTPGEQERRQLDNADPRRNEVFREHLERVYGGCWDFNEIIGHIRLHFLGTQVRGEYFAVAAQRIVRTRTKNFEYRAWKLAPEVEVELPYGAVEVLTAVRQYIEDCKNKLPRRYLDTSKFDVIADHLDWAGLFRDGL